MATPVADPANEPLAPSTDPVSNSTPPSTPASPTVSLPIPNSSLPNEEDLEALSPMRVLQKNRPTTSPLPPPSPSVTPPPPPSPSPSAPLAPEVPAVSTPQVVEATPPIDKEGLLRQAATAPSDSFILPTHIPTPASAEVPTELTKPPMPVSQQSNSPLGEDLDEDPRPLAPLPPKPLQSKPTPPLAPTPPSPLNKELSKKPLSISQEPSSKPSGRHGLLLAGLGSVIALAILAGGGYALAYTGARVPFFYGLVSGLPTSGLTVGRNALASLNKQKSYQLSGESSLTLQKAKSSLPDAPSPGGAVTPLSGGKSLTTSADPVTYDKTSGSWIGHFDLTLNSSAPVPYYVNTGSGSSNWLVYLPATSSTTVLKTSGDDLKQTLLYPLVRPVALEELLAALQTEKKYDKKILNGHSVAHYTYTVNKDKLSSALPDSASLDQASSEVYYNWKTGQPVQATLQGVLNYQNQQYDFKESWQIMNWNNPASQGATANLQKVLDLGVSSQPLAVADFLSQLGIGSLQAIPNTLSNASEGNTGGQPQAIVPSGEGITQALPSLTTIPPIPKKPATSEAKARDTQRINDLHDLQQALEHFKAKEGSYPTTGGIEQTRSSATLITGLVPSYLTKMPIDPLKDTYWYEYQSDGVQYQLRAVAENPDNPQAIKGKAYSYFQLSGTGGSLPSPTPSAAPSPASSDTPGESPSAF